MKTKFSNAEKVSDRFLEIKQREIAERFGNYIKNKVKFVVEPFCKKLDMISKSCVDNYEKLKALIRLEREFEDYITSKEFLKNIILYFIKGATHYNSYIRRENYMYKGLIVIGEYKGFADSNENALFSLLFGTSEAALQNVYEFLDRKFLPKEENFSIESIAKTMNESDKAELISTLKCEYRKLFKIIFEHGNSIAFDEFFSDEGLLVLFRVAMEAFWEVFEYSSEEEMATKFKSFLISATIEDAECIRLARDTNFWRLLVEFDEFYSENDMVLSNNVQLYTNVLEKSFNSGVTLRKVVSLEELGPSKILCGLDLTGLDLSKFDFSGYTILDCNMNGTNASIDLCSINQETSIYYIRGKKVDLKNLTGSCFKGCQVTGFYWLKEYAFSSDTFDEEILKKSGFWLEGIDKMIIEKYYRKIYPTVLEFGTLLGKIDKASIFNRYKDIENASEFDWILKFEEIFPGNDVFVSF